MEISVQNNIISVAGLGTLECYTNPYHREHVYLRPRLDRYDPERSASLFAQVAHLAGKPLQVMCGSGETELIGFLERGGFQLKRRCFECEAGADALRGVERPALVLQQCVRGEASYERCCRLLYEKYRDDHEAVNPLTAAFEEFAGDLPETVLYTKAGTAIRQFAFVEDDEITYAGGEESSFAEFAAAVAYAILEKRESICFEADDCDRTAMILKDLLCPEVEESYNTYVLLRFE